MPEARFAAVLWDLDGTIADTHHLIHDCLDYTLNKHIGRGLERDVWEQWVGVPLRDLFPVAYAHHGLDAPGPEAVASLTQCYRTRLAEVDSGVEVFPGIRVVLSRLNDSGVAQGIVTTKHRSAAERTLRNLGIRELFEVVVCGDDCAHHKPHPAPFVKASDLLGVEPSRCAVVGDSPADILGAKAAGMHAVAAKWGAAGLDATPDSSAARPEDVLVILGVST